MDFELEIVYNTIHCCVSLVGCCVFSLFYISCSTTSLRHGVHTSFYYYFIRSLFSFQHSPIHILLDTQWERTEFVSFGFVSVILCKCCSFIFLSRLVRSKFNSNGDMYVERIEIHPCVNKRRRENAPTKRKLSAL